MKEPKMAEGMTTGDVMPANHNVLNDHPEIRAATGRVDQILAYGVARMPGLVTLIARGDFPATDPKALSLLATCMALAGVSPTVLHDLVKRRAIEIHGLSQVARNSDVPHRVSRPELPAPVRVSSK
jgi:hypothetical protein